MCILKTERLYIYEARLEDSRFFYDLLNSPNWLKFIGDRNIHSIEDAKTYIQKSILDSYKFNGFGLYKLCIKETNQAIGISGFLQRDYLSIPDLGFAVLPEFERQNYTFEASSGLLNYAKEELQLEEVLAITTDENQASQDLLRKLGFSKSGQIQPKANQDFLIYRRDL